jgi:hypothetical protein
MESLTNCAFVHNLAQGPLYFQCRERGALSSELFALGQPMSLEGFASLKLSKHVVIIFSNPKFHQSHETP